MKVWLSHTFYPWVLQSKQNLWWERKWWLLTEIIYEIYLFKLFIYLLTEIIYLFNLLTEINQSINQLIN